MEARRQFILSNAMTLTVFQVGVDVEHSQMLNTAADFDVSLFAKPANGESIAGRSWPSTFTVFDPGSPRTNFFYLHDSFLMMDELAENSCRGALSKQGELVRVGLESVGGLYLFNPWLALELDAINWSETTGRLGVYWNLGLKKEHIPRAAIFRLPKISGLYLSSELKDDADDFLFLYRRHQLSGLYFKKLWDERSGGVPGRSTARGMDC